MIEAGILREDERVQLIDGMLVAMTPQGRPHAFVIQELNRLLVRALGDDFKVLTQLPLTLGGNSEPEPDLAVVRAHYRPQAHRAALLVIEVGRLARFDRRTAASARTGIPEY
jgi:Uma2 family endonuclease